MLIRPSVGGHANTGFDQLIEVDKRILNAVESKFTADVSSVSPSSLTLVIRFAKRLVYAYQLVDQIQCDCKSMRIVL